MEVPGGSALPQPTLPELPELEPTPVAERKQPGARTGARGRKTRGRDRGAESRGRTVLSTQMQKTKLCDFHREGRCKYGADCAFAHDEFELRTIPDLRKTRICKAFTQGKCEDPECKFAHGAEELRPSDLCYKTALCTWYEKDKCASGEQCRFAHGPRDLRLDEPPTPGSHMTGAAPDRSAQLSSAAPAGPRLKLKRRLSKRLAKSDAGQAPATASETGDDARPQKRARAEAPVCYRCGSTVATHLGFTHCAVCKY